MKNSLVLAAALLAGTAGADEPAGVLIQQLGSSHHPTRDAAHKALAAKTDQDTTDRLLQAMKSGDPEVATRARAILQPYLDDQKEKRILGQIQKIKADCGGVLPQIDLGPFAWEESQHYCRQAAGTSFAPDWSKYRNATEIMLRDAFQYDADVPQLIETMKQHERTWLRTYNAYGSPKTSVPWDEPAR